MSRNSPHKIPRKPPFDSDRDTVAKLINLGWSDARIADKYGVTKDTIWCRRSRWNLASGPETKENKFVQDMKVLWKEGYTVQEIAKILGVSLRTMYSKMRIYHVKDIPRLGVQAPCMTISQVRQAMADKSITDNDTVLVTHNWLPKWVMVPVETYQDLINGVYQHLRHSDTVDDSELSSESDSDMLTSS